VTTTTEAIERGELRQQAGIARAAERTSADEEDMGDTRFVTLDDLASYGLTLAEVRRLDPAPVEYRALDGSPCWCRDELLPLLIDRGHP
jgi:hypothetical protein